MGQGDEARLEAWLAGRGAGRALVVVAHPDDEVLGCGALLGRIADVEVVHVTDGAPRRGDDARNRGYGSPDDYAAARAAEARAALAVAGVAPERLAGFGVPDQEASLHLPGIAERLGPAVAAADLVLTHAYEGGHSDHDAVAFAVQAACARTGRPGRFRVEMPFYHAGREDWRRQLFLPAGGAGAEHVLILDPAERDRKAAMVAAHRSQAETLGGFEIGAERFRLAPTYDFTRRPHGGELLYERHGWNLTWAEWVARVRAAGAALALTRS